jgi:hypothetical protein
MGHHWKVAGRRSPLQMGSDDIESENPRLQHASVQELCTALPLGNWRLKLPQLARPIAHMHTGAQRSSCYDGNNSMLSLV